MLYQEKLLLLPESGSQLLILLTDWDSKYRENQDDQTVGVRYTYQMMMKTLRFFFLAKKIFSEFFVWARHSLGTLRRLPNDPGRRVLLLPVSYRLIRKLKPAGVIQFSQSHIARKWQRQDLSSNSILLTSITLPFNCSISLGKPLFFTDTQLWLVK